MLMCRKSDDKKHITMSLDHIEIDLDDGTRITAPLDAYPHLPGESIKERGKWEAMRWWVWQDLAHARHRRNNMKALDRLSQ